MIISFNFVPKMFLTNFGPSTVFGKSEKLSGLNIKKYRKNKAIISKLGFMNEDLCRFSWTGANMLVADENNV